MGHLPTSDPSSKARNPSFAKCVHQVDPSSTEHFLDALLTRFERLGRQGLRLVFHFDAWHTSPLRERLYARDVISYLNARSLERRVRLAEIGCGLGDIVRRVRYEFRVGLDAEPRVLRAACFLALFGYKPSPIFERFVFPEGTLNGRYDAIVLVNWIHHIHPDVLGRKIMEYACNHLSIYGIIVIDTVSDPEYRHNHDIVGLTSGFDCTVTEIGSYARGRIVYAIAPNTA
jgi:SAM-dependent methyltransferase